MEIVTKHALPWVTLKWSGRQPDLKHSLSHMHVVHHLKTNIAASFYHLPSDRHVDSLMSYARPSNFYEELHGSSTIPSQTVHPGYSQIYAMAFGFSSSLPHGQLRSDNIDVELENKDLWDKFHEIGTEMIITKTGR